MKIDPERLRTLRDRKGLSRPELHSTSGITSRTIQRLENEPERCGTTRKDTVNCLAKALDVEPGVLTGELPLPDSDNAPAVEPEAVQIGARIAPKVRLAYDLIKRRYGVNPTHIINMAPLFFILLAEGSIAQRRERLREARESATHLDQLAGFWRGGLGTGMDAGIWPGIERERESIREADLFGEHLTDEPESSLVDRFFFDPSEDNPFARYLRKLAADLDIPGVVDVGGGHLDFRTEFRFPRYGVCDDELDRIANASPIGRAALETELLRLSEIPVELMAEDKGGERQTWLENRMSEKFSGLEDEVLGEFLRNLAQFGAVSPRTQELLEEIMPRTKNSETENGGYE